MSIEMTGAQAVVAQLAAQGVRTLLTIPGIHTLPICDAALDIPGLRSVHGRHEQGIAYMANGYARASHTIAVPLVITGPGVTNALTPLADAYLDSVPMVLLASAIDREREGRGAFHELKDQTAVLAGVCKWNTRVERVSEIPGAIRSAFEQAFAGRPGPTAVEIPVGVQTASGPADVYPAPPPAREAADPAGVAAAVERLKRAQAPVLFAGRGAAVSDAGPALIRLAETLNAPVFTTPLAKGVVPEDHPLCLSWGGVRAGLVREFLEEADLVLVVGSSLDEADGSRYRFAFENKLIQIDACESMIGRLYPVEVGLVGDARAVLEQILGELGPAEIAARPSPAARIAGQRARTQAEVQPQRMWQYIDAIERALPRDGFVANDGSRVNSWANAFLRRSRPLTYAVTRNTAALGFAWPAAVGAKLAFPERASMAIVGDGGFLFTSFTLATAVQHRIGAVAVVFNDASYGTIARIQQRNYGREVGAALHNPDFVRLAEVFGACGQRVETPGQLYEALCTAWGRQGPTLIEVPLEADVGFA